MGTLLGSAFKSSEERAQKAVSHSEHWLEAAMDGLLTVEAERFLLSLPLEAEPNLLANLRPQIINELAELRMFRNRVLKRIDDLLRIAARWGLDAGLEKRVTEELSRLKAFFSEATGSSPVQPIAA